MLSEGTSNKDHKKIKTKKLSCYSKVQEMAALSTKNGQYFWFIGIVESQLIIQNVIHRLIDLPSGNKI